MAESCLSGAGRANQCNRFSWINVHRQMVNDGVTAVVVGGIRRKS